MARVRVPRIPANLASWKAPRRRSSPRSLTTIARTDAFCAEWEAIERLERPTIAISDHTRVRRMALDFPLWRPVSCVYIGRADTSSPPIWIARWSIMGNPLRGEQPPSRSDSFSSNERRRSAPNDAFRQAAVATGNRRGDGVVVPGRLRGGPFAVARTGCPHHAQPIVRGRDSPLRLWPGNGKSTSSFPFSPHAGDRRRAQ